MERPQQQHEVERDLEGIAAGGGTAAAAAAAMDKMQHLLTLLMQHQESGPFLEPVNWNELELFDYPEIVKHPMDLGTVQRKMERNEYVNAACAHDIRLIWTNCMAYNTEGSEFWLLGKSFKRRFEDKYRRIKNDFDVGEEPEDAESLVPESPTGSNNHHAVPDHNEDLRDEEEEEEDVTELSSPATVSDTLADQLLNLTQSQLGKIVQRVQRECPQALKFPLPELLELETENLSQDIVEQIAQLSSQQQQQQQQQRGVNPLKREVKKKRTGPTIRYVNTTKRYKKERL